MEKYLEIGKENVKFNMGLHLLVCAVLLSLSPLVLGIKNLTAADTAKVLEMYVSLLGIILLTPVFLPEQNKDLRDLVSSKYIKSTSVYLVRIVEAAAALLLMLGIYIGVLFYNNCDMHIQGYFFGTFAGMMFLGGLGIFFYGMFDSLVVGYLIPIFYYIYAIGGGKKYLGMFYPFSMSMGSYKEKYYLAGAALLLIAAGIALRGRKK